MPDPSTPAPAPRALLADPAIRRAVADVVRRRVPPGEVDDIVQATLTEAVASESAPQDPDALRRWVIGIARHKVADFFRRSRREVPDSSPEPEAPPGAESERDMVRWAARHAEGADGQRTLEWMLREGEGEKLESIAADERVPAPRVRQRVSRLRRLLRQRWAVELAAVAAVAILVGAAWWIAGRRRPEETIVRDVPTARPSAPTPAPSAPDPRVARGRDLRREALEKCAASEWRACLDGLDAAAAIDPDGDRAEDVARARETAGAALRAPAPSAPAPTVAPPPAPKAVPPEPAKPAPAPQKGEGKPGKPTKAWAPTESSESLPPPSNAEPQQATPQQAPPTKEAPPPPAKKAAPVQTKHEGK